MAVVDIELPRGVLLDEQEPSVSVPVVCGALTGMLLLPRRRILINAGTAGECEVSPTEFERLGGKGRAKKWWMSIRTQDGQATIGEWLVARGFDPTTSQRSFTSKLGLDCAAASAAASGVLLKPNGSGSNPLLFSAGSGPSGVSNLTNNGSGLLHMSSSDAGLHQRLAGGGAADAAAAAGLRPSAALEEHMHWDMAAAAGAGEGWGAPPQAPAPGAAAPRAPVLMPLGRQRLPGDGSEAVAAMADYLAGLAAAPPLHLLQRGGPPLVDGRPLDLRALFGAVASRGGYAAVTSGARWQEVLLALGLGDGGLRPGGGGVAGAPAFRAVHGAYVDLLLRFERMYDTELWESVTGRPSPILGMPTAAATQKALQSPGIAASSHAAPPPLRAQLSADLNAFAGPPDLRRGPLLHPAGSAPCLAPAGMGMGMGGGGGGSFYPLEQRPSKRRSVNLNELDAPAVGRPCSFSGPTLAGPGGPGPIWQQLSSDFGIPEGAAAASGPPLTRFHSVPNAPPSHAGGWAGAASGGGGGGGGAGAAGAPGGPRLRTQYASVELPGAHAGTWGRRGGPMSASAVYKEDLALELGSNWELARPEEAPDNLDAALAALPNGWLQPRLQPRRQQQQQQTQQQQQQQQQTQTQTQTQQQTQQQQQQQQQQQVQGHGLCPQLPPALATASSSSGQLDFSGLQQALRARGLNPAQPPEPSAAACLPASPDAPPRSWAAAGSSQSHGQKGGGDSCLVPAAQLQPVGGLDLGPDVSSWLRNDQGPRPGALEPARGRGAGGPASPRGGGGSLVGLQLPDVDMLAGGDDDGAMGLSDLLDDFGDELGDLPGVDGPLSGGAPAHSAAACSPGALL